MPRKPRKTLLAPRLTVAQVAAARANLSRVGATRLREMGMLNSADHADGTATRLEDPDRAVRAAAQAESAGITALRDIWTMSA